MGYVFVLCPHAAPTAGKIGHWNLTNIQLDLWQLRTKIMMS
jgi:hypothetical protein